MQHAAKRFRVGLVHTLEDRLAQSFLALGGQEQFFDELPTLFAARAHQRLGDVTAHAADRVLTVGGVDEDLEHSIAGAVAELQGPGQQPAEISRVVPTSEVRRPGGNPFDVAVVLAE